MTEQFFYSAEIRRWLVQLIRMFSEFTVQYGKTSSTSDYTYVRVPVTYGDSTRMVQTILANNSENIMQNPAVTTVTVGTTNPVTIGGATGSCSGKVANADGTGCTAMPTVPAASSTTPVMDGTAAIGSAATYAKADHVHPTDTSRAPVASPTFTGVVGTTHNVLDDGNGNATFGGRVSAGAPFAFASLSSQTGMLVNDIVTVTDGCTGGGAVALCICTAATSGTCTALGSVSGSQIPTTTVSSGAISQTSPNQYVICTTTCTVTPLTPTAGKQICVRNGPGVSTAITLAALGAGNYYELTSHASWGTANHTVVSGGAATDSICLVGYDANHYAVFSYNGTWTD